MNKDCNGCFGASFNDCQKCQRTEKQPPKLDITPELAIAAYNTLIDTVSSLTQKQNVEIAYLIRFSTRNQTKRYVL